MNDDLRTEVSQALKGPSGRRLTPVLAALGISSSSWYRRVVEPRKPPGPKPQTVPWEIARFIEQTALSHPWYGYHKIAIISRRTRSRTTDRQVYKVMKARNLLKRRRSRKAKLHEARKLFDLLPTGPNELWQMDVTYIHIPGRGWRYAVTVIDYYSRYLLAVRLCDSYSAQAVAEALDWAMIAAEDLHGELKHRPYLVTDNGSSFIARRFCRHIAGSFRHVRIQYRTPQQLGLLERFHRTLKDEEVYWQLYDSPQQAQESLDGFRDRYNRSRPHWALKPEEGGDVLTPAEVYINGQRTQIPKWQGWARAAKAKLEEFEHQEVIAAA